MEEAPRDNPPASPVIGNCYIVGASPTGDWAGKPQFVAAFTGGGWRLLAPIEGMSLYVKAEERCANYRAGTWEMGIVRGSSLMIGGEQVVGARAPAIPDPAAGSVIDSEARTAIGAILAALRQHGLIEQS